MFRFTCNVVEYSKFNWNSIQNLLVLTDFFIFVLQVRGRFDNQRKQQAENLKIWKNLKGWAGAKKCTSVHAAVSL